MPFVTLKHNFKTSISAKLAVLLGIGIFLSVAVAAFAAESPDASIASKGIVQCGGAGEPLCTLCDLYSGTRRMINFLLFFHLQTKISGFIGINFIFQFPFKKA